MPVLKESMALYCVATHVVVGNGRTALFWEERWLEGQRICEIAPAVYGRVSRRARRTQTVLAATSNHTWARDIGPDLTAGELEEFLRLWHKVSTVQLTEDSEDTVRWAWEQHGQFSAHSAYGARFMGLETSPTAAFTWQSKAPLKCRFYAWLTFKDRCWTSERLARRGLPHQDACPLCDQEESPFNIYLSTVPLHDRFGTGLSREQADKASLLGRANHWKRGHSGRREAASTRSPRALNVYLTCG